MTKRVRIENADTADYRVLVEVWDRGYPAGEPDVLVKTVELNYPTAMTDDGVYITSTRWLVVKEVPKVVVTPQVTGFVYAPIPGSTCKTVAH